MHIICKKFIKKFEQKNFRKSWCWVWRWWPCWIIPWPNLWWRRNRIIDRIRQNKKENPLARVYSQYLTHSAKRKNNYFNDSNKLLFHTFFHCFHQIIICRTLNKPYHLVHIINSTYYKTIPDIRLFHYLVMYYLTFFIMIEFFQPWKLNIKTTKSNDEWKDFIDLFGRPNLLTIKTLKI